jgi:Leucine-rich repeat (LRR) protein
LNLSGNLLTALPSLNLTALETLDVSYNQLTVLPGLPIETLLFLDAGVNELVDVSTLALASKLEHLRLVVNQLESMESFFFMESLEFLDLRLNKLESIEGLREGLRLLYIGDNRFSALPDLPDSLEVLHAANNQIENISSVETSFNLTNLTLSGNHLNDLDTFYLYGLTQLSTLGIGNNAITQFDQLKFELPNTSINSDEGRAILNDVLVETTNFQPNSTTYYLTFLVDGSYSTNSEIFLVNDVTGEVYRNRITNSTSRFLVSVPNGETRRITSLYLNCCGSYNGFAVEEMTGLSVLQ